MVERTPKILIVDDDPRLRDLLRRYLGENGFNVLVSENGEAMKRLWVREHFDVLILDLMMPGEDGLAILKRLRAEKDMTPVIMLTARGEDVDRILGLELGADDYLGKPFNPRELLARIHAVLRRRPRQDAPGAPSMENEVVKFGDFELDLGTRVLKKNGEIVPLTTGEFAVLKAFARHPRQPLSRDKLMEMARAVNMKPLTVPLTFRFRVCVSSLSPIPRSPAICRQSGDWDTSLSRTVTLNYASERSTDRLSNRPARACLRLELSREGNLIARGICQMAKLFPSPSFFTF